MNDEELFKQMLGDDVEPIVTEARVAVKKTRDQDVDKAQRRKAAASVQSTPADPLSSSPVDMVEPLSLLTYRKPGVQHGVYKKMRLGKYALDARLDLHRMTVEQARRTVYQFVQDCVANDVRCALVTHGKGEGRETPALLKSCIAHWLPQLDEVLAFHTAQKHHGSYGATYVLFKKSDNKKLENKELNRRKK